MSIAQRMKARAQLSKAIVEAFPDTMVSPAARIDLAAAIEDLIDVKLESLRADLERR